MSKPKEKKKTIWNITRLAVCAVLVMAAGSCGGGGGDNSLLQLNNGLEIYSQLEVPVTSKDQISEPILVDQVVAEIESVPVPEGVDSVLWKQLTAELVRVLSESGNSEIIQHAPDGDRNQVSDLRLVSQDGLDYQLEWTYRNVGDYDRNGLVDENDIVPIALYWNAKAGSPEWEQAFTADGDKNDIVNISDITPIGQNWYSTVAGYFIQSASDLEGSWENIGSVPFSNTAALPDSTFSTSVSAPGSAKYLAISPYDESGNEGFRSVVSRIGLDAELVLSNLSPTSALPGTTITVTGSGFNGPSSEITVDWQDFKLPLTVDSDEQGSFIVPPVPCGSYPIRLTNSIGVSMLVSFEVLEPDNLTYSQEEFGQLLSTGMGGFNWVVQDLIEEAVVSGELGLSTEQLSTLSELHSLLNDLVNDLSNEIDSLSTSDAELMQCYFENSGINNVFVDFSDIFNGSKQSSSFQPLHAFLVAGDIVSAAINIIKPVLTVITIASVATTPASGGLTLGVAITTAKMQYVLLIIDYLLDTLLPTDLYKITYSLSAGPYVVGETIPLVVSGSFRSQSRFVSSTISALFDVWLSLVGGSAGGSWAVQLQKLILSELNKWGLNTTIYLVEEGILWENNPDQYQYLGHPIQLDMGLYHLELHEILSLVYPNSPFGTVTQALTLIGVPLPELNPVIIGDNTILEYSAETDELIMKSEGSTTIQVYAWCMGSVPPWSLLYFFPLETPKLIQGNTVNVVVDIDTGELRPPLAVIEADETVGVEPFRVYFEGYQSRDRDEAGEEIVQYAWDWDGDGDTDLTGTDPNIHHTYYSEGVYNATLTVTDDESDTDSASVLITVNPAPPKTYYVAGWVQNGAEVGIENIEFELDPGGYSATSSGEYGMFNIGKVPVGTYTLRPKQKHIDDGWTFTPSEYANITVDHNVGNKSFFANLTPTVSIDVSPTEVTVGSSVNLTAIGGDDPDGGAVQYYWDTHNTLPNDYEPSGGWTGPFDLPDKSETYNSSDVFYPRVMVVDDEGDYCVDVFTSGLTVNGNPPSI